MNKFTILATSHAAEINVEADSEDEALELAADQVLAQTTFDILEPEEDENDCTRNHIRCRNRTRPRQCRFWKLP